MPNSDVIGNWLYYVRVPFWSRGLVYIPEITASPSLRKLCFRVSSDNVVSLYLKKCSEVSGSADRRYPDFRMVRGKSGDSSLLTCRSAKTSTDDIRAGFGALGKKRAMSGRQRREVRERVAAIDKHYPRKSRRFITLTLPSVDLAAYRALAEWSSYVVNRLNVWIGRLVGEHARVSVWEYQDRGALHLHAIIGGEAVGLVTTELLRSYWVTLLEDIQERTNADMFLGSDGQDWREAPDVIRVESAIPEKSLSSYLAKYLSKGIKDEQSNRVWKDREGWIYPVPSWCQWNRDATTLRGKYTIESGLGYTNYHGYAEVVRRFYSRFADKNEGEGVKPYHSKNPYVPGIYFFDWQVGGVSEAFGFLEELDDILEDKYYVSSPVELLDSYLISKWENMRDAEAKLRQGQDFSDWITSSGSPFRFGEQLKGLLEVAESCLEKLNSLQNPLQLAIL